MLNNDTKARMITVNENKDLELKDLKPKPIYAVNQLTIDIKLGGSSNALKKPLEKHCGEKFGFLLLLQTLATMDEWSSTSD